MLYEHYTEVPPTSWVWKNFAPWEMACPCCGELYLDVHHMNLLQAMRDILGKPMGINSAHRCEVHNAIVGGAVRSQHLELASDVSLIGHNRYDVYEAAKKAGFTTFGFYRTFIHLDPRPFRRWFGTGGEAAWKSLVF